jgi:hypothetical protein
MADRLKKLIKNLPPVEPRKKAVDELVAQIVRREIRRLWEKRASIFTAAVSVLLGISVVRQIIKVAKMLDTSGFWRLLISDFNWWIKDPPVLCSAFLEANPFRELTGLILLLAIFFLSLYILKRDD